MLMQLHSAGRGFSNEKFPHPRDLVLQRSLRSPDITPCVFLFWCYITDLVFVPPLATDVDELKTRISAVIQINTPDMLKNVWDELSYRIHIVHVSEGANIEHLWLCWI